MLAPWALLLASLSGCATAGPPVLGPLFVDPSGLSSPRDGRLVEQPQWVSGPDDIDFGLLARFRATIREAGSGAEEPDGDRADGRLTGSVTLECLITAEGLLSLCAPYQGPAEWSPALVRPYIAAMQLATSMKMEPFDLSGEPVAGGRTRITINWPEVEVPPSDDEVTLARMLNRPGPWEYTGLFPQRAYQAGADGDVVLICVVAANGLTEGCEVFFESASEVGFGEASRQLYRNIRILPPTVNGKPQRALVMSTVRWRQQ